MPSARQARRLRKASAGRKGDLHGIPQSPSAAFRGIPRNLLLVTVSGLALFVGTPQAPARPLGGSAPPRVTAPAASPETGQAALQAQAALKRTTQAIQAMQAAQRAAREAAAAAASNVPNGLQTGGLQVAPGAVPGTDLWQGANAPTEVVNGVKTDVTIKQNQQKAILTWETFNVGRDTNLYFDQRGGKAADGSNSWVVLNRVLRSERRAEPDSRGDQGRRPSLHHQSERNYLWRSFADQCRVSDGILAQHLRCGLQGDARRHELVAVRNSGLHGLPRIHRRCDGGERRENHRRERRPSHAARPERHQFR